MKGTSRRPHEERTVRAVLYQESSGWWSAQCLEYDVATQAKTLPTLYRELERVLLSYFVVSNHLGVEPFSGLPPAPKHFQAMFYDGKPAPKNGAPHFKPLGDLNPRIVPELRISQRSQQHH